MLHRYCVLGVSFHWRQRKAFEKGCKCFSAKEPFSIWVDAPMSDELNYAIFGAWVGTV